MNSILLEKNSLKKANEGFKENAEKKEDVIKDLKL